MDESTERGGRIIGCIRKIATESRSSLDQVLTFATVPSSHSRIMYIERPEVERNTLLVQQAVWQTKIYLLLAKN